MLDRLTENETSQLFLIAEKTASAAFKLYKYIKTKQKENKAKLDKKIAELTKKANENLFLFRGNIYDLSYFWDKRKLALNEIEKIPDEALRQAVKKNINELVKEGYITLSDEKDCLILTQKGEELINSPNFISSAALDRMNVCEKIKVAVSQKQKTVPNEPEINFNDNLVNNSSEIIRESAKKEANTAPKKATEQASVTPASAGATEKTACKAVNTIEEIASSANKAVSGSAKAAAGAATAGTGAVVQAAYEAANSVFKKIGKEL